MEIDDKYRQLGFKCGLEIHQQLLTRQKLFCRCPAGYRNDKPDGEIIRHMRPTLSELGEYDGTALMEFKTKKNVVYQLYRENCCTYEMDDTPPFPINPQALEIAMKLAVLLNCAVVDELHVSRKQYLDGSIPTGFQRTAIVGVGGWLPYKGRKISITHLCLEEDSCREVQDIGHEITFRTDRLSTPLLEVITGPDMLTPREAMEVDAMLGRILKGSGLVRRGLGSVRQDVNVSIAGGNRAEIKGVPQTWMIEKLTAIEAERQAALLGIMEMLRQRGITDRTIHCEKFDLFQILKDSGIAILDRAMSQGWAIRAIKLDGFAGVFGVGTQPGMTFASEVAGRLRVIACLDQMPNMAVSDIPGMAGFDVDIWQKIKKACGCKHTDAVVVTWGTIGDVVTALSEIEIRAIEATKGVPLETRQALKDGNTDFERILPGPDRMYPDTDSPPVAITKQFIDRLRSELPEPANEIEERWISAGVPERIAQKAVVSPFARLFDELVCENDIAPLLAWAALNRIQARDRLFVESQNGTIIGLFEAHKAGRISRDSLFEILSQVDNDGSGPLHTILEEHELLDSKDKMVQELILEFANETLDASFRSPDERVNYICGRVKKRFGGRIDGLSLQKEVAGKVRQVAARVF